MKMLDTVLKKIKPKSFSLSDFDTVKNKINKQLKKKKVQAECIFGGSVAKGTNLSNFDCDIFVKFSMKYKNKDLSDILDGVLKVFSNYERIHGSRDYFQLKQKGIVYEIVPVLDIKNTSDAMNITDFSLFHVDWVKKNIKNYSDDVKLAKAFCKAQGVYGAESYINGFSGYILEILTINYGGFMNLIKGVSKWKPKTIIDINRSHRGKDVFKELNFSKLQSPIIVIDPVQKDRNASASVGVDKFGKFILAAKDFLTDPDNSFFEKKKFSINELKQEAKRLGVTLVLFNVKPIEGKQDIVGSKLLKALNYMKNKIEREDFFVFDYGWEFNTKAIFWYFIYPNKLPNFKKHMGPLVYSKDIYLKSFLNKHDSLILESSRIYAKVKREHKTVDTLIPVIIKDPWLKDKLRSIKWKM